MVWVWVWVCGWGWGLRFGSGVSAGGVSLRLEACPAAGAGSFGAGRGLPAWCELFRRGRVLRLGGSCGLGKVPWLGAPIFRDGAAGSWLPFGPDGRFGPVGVVSGFAGRFVAGRRGLGGACHRWWTARVGSGGTV